MCYVIVECNGHMHQFAIQRVLDEKTIIWVNVQSGAMGQFAIELVI